MMADWARKLKSICVHGLILVIAGILIFSGSCIVPVKTPSGTEPQLKIIAPVSSTAAGNITVTVQVSNFTLKMPQGNNRSHSSTGHIIYYLDQPAPLYFDIPAITLGGTYIATAETSYTWTDVTPGTHTFSAQLVNNDNTALIAPAVDKVTITVGAPQGNPALTIQPPDGTQLPPGIVIITAQVSSFIISQKDMGSVNRDGEGHFIYYMDEDPPTDQGAPAKTDASITSANFEQRWTNVVSANHTFTVQLVNNDDTPLNPPVTAKVTLDIQ